MQILETFGPGRYSLAPLTTGTGGGAFLPSFACVVGPPDELRPTMATKRESAEVVELKRELENLRSKSSELDAKALLTTVVGNLDKIGALAGHLKAEGIGVKDLMTFATALRDGDRGGMNAEEAMSMFKTFKEMMPMQEPDDSGITEVAAKLIEGFMNRGNSAPQAPQFAGAASPGPMEVPPGQIGLANAPPASNQGLDFGAVAWQFVQETLEEAAQSGNPAAVAGGVINFLNAADSMQLGEHPRILEFASAPAVAFDKLAEVVPSLQGELQTEARSILVEQIEASIGNDDHATTGAPGD